MPFEVKNVVAIITGSAQGFGKEFAKRLLRKGAKVCLSDVNSEMGEKTLEELRRIYGQQNVTFKSCDVTKEDEWADLWAHAENELQGKVAILINNAGIHPGHGWRNCLNIMLTGVAIGTYLAIEKMGTSKGGHGGRVINIASMAGLLTGLRGIEGCGYTMAKHGVVALTRSFANSMNPQFDMHVADGIKAYALCPYFANTQLVRDITNLDELQKRIKSRVLTVEEVGHALDESLKLDTNGACYVVYPDCPVFSFPDGNRGLIMAMVAFGHYLGAPLSLDTFTIKHVALAALLALFFIYFILTCVIF